MEEKDRNDVVFYIVYNKGFFEVFCFFDEVLFENL